MNPVARVMEWLIPSERKNIIGADGALVEWSGYSRQDGDNFRTNRVTYAEWQDNGTFNAGSALVLPTVWACTNLVAGTTGSLPATVTKSVKGGVDEEQWDHDLYGVLNDSPNADQTPLDFLEFCAASVELQGNAYSEVERASNGRVIALDEPTPPDCVTVSRASGGQLEYEVTKNGRRRVIPQDRILHIRGFGGSALGGLSTLAFGRHTFGMATTLERAAAHTFRNGARPSGILSIDKALSAQQRAEAERLLQEKYQGTVNSGVPMVLDNGLKWQGLSITPEDSQMLESRSFSVEEICRFFSVPPHLVGHTANSTSWGTGLEQQTLAFLIFTMRRRLKRFEQAMTKQLLSRADRNAGLKVKFDLRGLMRGDSKARAEFYATALRNGWMTINEVRALEGLPPVEGGDVPRLQMQNVPITEAGNGLTGEQSNAA
jgi:HK97 family phage portal protein